MPRYGGHNRHHHKSSGSPFVIVVFVMVLGFAGTYVVVMSNASSNLLDTIPRALQDSSSSSSASFSLLMTNPFSSSMSTKPKKNPGKFPPFSCPQLLEEMKTKKTAVPDPNLGKLYGRLTTTNPPFYISLHNATFDKTRWPIYDSGNYYEFEQVQAFQQVLSNSPPYTRVIDVGGNIGFFSLLSAATHRTVTVDTFEPNVKNCMRYCESLAVNRWFHTEFENDNDVDDETASRTHPLMNPYIYGVGKEAGMFQFQEHDSNPGGGAFTEQKVKDGSAVHGLQIITLDAFAKERGWFESRPDIAILKVDVEGKEANVMEGAKELLQAHLIRNIFMEVSVRTPEETQENIPFLQFLTSKTRYQLHQIGGWMGPHTDVRDWPTDEQQLPQKILDAAAAEQAKQLNLWWILPSTPTQPPAPAQA
jgi:FkbM family methyltransferase